MRVKHFALPFLFLVFIPASVSAQTKPPTVALRVNSIDSLIEHVKFLTALAGQKDAARQIDALIKSKIGDKGLEGVDAKRPFGFYARVGKDLEDISGAILLPIADGKAFLDLLNRLGFPATKGEKGVYTVNTGSPIPAYLRFAKKYAYVTALNVAALDDKNLLDPAEVLAGSPTNAFTLAVQLDQVPETAKLITSAQVEQVLQEEQDRKIPGESAAHKAGRLAGANAVAKFIATVLKEGKELSAKVDLDQKSGDLSATFALSGVTGSELSTGIANTAKNSSMFGGLLQKGAAFNGMGRIKLPDALVKAFGDMIDAEFAAKLRQIPNPTEKKLFEALTNAILPTFKSGDYDGAFVVLSNNRQLTLLGGFKVKNGNDLDTTARSLAKDLAKELPPKTKDMLKFDVDAVDTVKIHRLTFPADDPHAQEVAKVLGELTAYVAFRNDAMFISVGKDGLSAIKSAIPMKGSVAPGPMLFYEADIAKFAFLAPPPLAAKAKTLFPGDQGGVVRVSVEGGSALTLRFSTKVAVLQFLGQGIELQMGN